MIERIARAVDGFVPAILAKELRQGLNGWGFMAQFYGMHALLAFLTLTQIAGLSQARDGSFSVDREVFWFFIAAYFLFIVPMTCVNAISSEKRGGTMELIRMSGLSPRDIVWGKWAYQALIVCLVGFTIYPYLVIYHFASGNDIVAETMTLLFVVLISCIVAGLGVGASGFGSSHLKSLLFIVTLFAVVSMSIGLYAETQRSGDSFFNVGGLALLLVIGGLVMGFALEVGTLRVAATVDGHSFVLRLIGLILLILPLVLAALGFLPAFCIGMTVTAAVLVPWFVMMGDPVMVAGPYRRYVRFGKLGVFAGRFLFYPGWQTGVIYVVVVLLILYGSLSFYESIPEARISKREVPQMMYVFSALAMLPVQFCAVRVFLLRRNPATTLVKVIGVNALFVLFAFLVGVAKVFFFFDFTTITSFLPSNALVYLFFGVFESIEDTQAGLAVSLIGQVVLALIVLSVGDRYRKRFKHLEAEATEMNARAGKESG